MDGEPAEITLVGECMIGVELTQGDHRLEFVYDNPAFGLGWKISLLCTAALGLLIQAFYKPDWKKLLQINNKGA